MEQMTEQEITTIAPSMENRAQRRERARMERRAKNHHNDSYRPRLLRVPLTQAVVDNYAQDLHFPLAYAKLGYFTTEQFDKIGAALNVMWAALQRKPPKDPAVVIVIEGGMRTMNQVAARGDGTGNWKLTETELASVTAAANKAIEAMPHLNGLDIRNAMADLAKIRAEMRQAERKAA